jgi:hypothetical protein
MKVKFGYKNSNQILNKIIIGQGIFLRSRIPGSLDIFIIAFDFILLAPYPQNINFREKIALDTCYYVFEKKILEIIYLIYESSISKFLFGSDLENIIFILYTSSIFDIENNRGKGI